MCGRKASGAGRGAVVPTFAVTEATDIHTVASGPWRMEPNWGALQATSPNNAAAISVPPLMSTSDYLYSSLLRVPIIPEWELQLL